LTRSVRAEQRSIPIWFAALCFEILSQLEGRKRIADSLKSSMSG
jgi:hypothetical protein